MIGTLKEGLKQTDEFGELFVNRGLEQLKNAAPGLGAASKDLFKHFFEARAPKLKPDPNAQAEHTVIRRDKGTGEIIKYETFKPQSNPQNPNPWEPDIRFDRYGPAHFNDVTKQKVPTPHIQGKSIPGGVKKAEPHDIPK